MSRLRLFVGVCLVWLASSALLVAGESDCYEKLKDVDGFMLDLDGTMYNPDGLIPGAKDFFNWLVDNNKTFVFLSNSGAKGPEGVRAKLLTPPFKLQEEPLDLDHIYTAAVAVSDFLVDNAPEGSLLYVLQSTSTYGGLVDSFTRVLNRTAPPELLSTWTWRTDLAVNEVKDWALLAQQKRAPVYVVLINDGEISDIADPVTGKPGYTGWDFTTLSKATWLVENGATLVSHAPDTHNLVYDHKYDSLNLATPGPGTFAKLLFSATYPDALDRFFVVGKGGNMGKKYMIDKGVELLRRQGFSGDPAKQVVMVGDTLDTDIEAASHGGVLGLFVLSGVHDENDLKYYPSAVPTCTLPSVAAIPKVLGRRAHH